MTKTYLFNIDPVPAPRMSRADAWRNRPTVLRYFAFRDRLKELADKQGFKLQDSGMSIAFGLPLKKSYSVKKKELLVHAPHRQRPDIDNLLKAFFDGLTSEDCTIWQLDSVSKYWSEKGFIEVKTRKL